MTGEYAPGAAMAGDDDAAILDWPPHT